MKKNRLISSILIVVSLVAFSIGSIGAYASQQSMHVSPPNHRMILVPGETYTDSFIVANANDSTRALKYELSIGSFSESADGENGDDYGTVDHISVSNYNQIMDWITLDRTSGSVEPNEKDIISYTINVPEDAPAGGQYATIIVKDVTDSGGASSGDIEIQSVMQFASIIYAEIAGENKEIGSISSNFIPSLIFNSPLTAESMVRNDGNVHTDAEYELQVWPLFSDEEICTNVENPETSLILPESERYHAQTCDLPAVGVFKAKQTVEIFGESSTVEKMVIVCPLWLLFLILFVIIAFVIWIIMKIKRSNKERGM